MIEENPKVQADGICKLSAWITVLGDSKARSRQVSGVFEKTINWMCCSLGKPRANPRAQAQVLIVLL